MNDHVKTTLAMIDKLFAEATARHDYGAAARAVEALIRLLEMDVEAGGHLLPKGDA